MTAIVWFKMLFAAFIQGAATSFTAALVAPETFNLTTGLKPLATLTVISGLVSAAMYLKQSPLPGVDGRTLSITDSTINVTTGTGTGGTGSGSSSNLSSKPSPPGVPPASDGT